MKRVISVVAALALSLFAAVPAAAIETGPAHVTVGTGKEEGWVQHRTIGCRYTGQPGGSDGFVPGPATPPDGSGSLTIQSDGKTNIGRRHDGYNGLRLADLTALRYSTFTAASSINSVQAALDFDIYVDVDGNGSRDETLVFQAYYQPEGVKFGEWQRWNLMTGFFSLNGDQGDFPTTATGRPYSYTRTLAEYLALPGRANARVAGLIVLQGCVSENAFAGSSSFTDSVRVAFGPYDDTMWDFEPVAREEGDSATGVYRFSAPAFLVAERGEVQLTVERTNDTSRRESVSYRTANGSAVAGEDYTAASGTLLFEVGEARKTFTVAVADDSASEANEDFSVQLSRPTSGASLGSPAMATVTINDDDGGSGGNQPSVSFATSTASAPESNTSVALTVTRSSGSGTAAVSYATADNTARAGADYTSTSGSVTFAAGETSKSIAVPLLQDTVAEGDETFSVTLSGATGVVLGSPSTVTVTITDDETPSDSVTRLSGESRYHSAVAASKSSFPTDGSASAVVLTTGENFPDALPGTALAVAKGGPLLLTSSASLNQETEDEIKRVLGAGKTVFITGGEGAVSPGVASRLQSLGYSVVRYSGNDRYETAAKVADSGLGNPSTVILTTGLDFPDALAAGTAAAKAGASVLLTAGSTMPQATRDYLAAHPPSKKYAVGGPSAAADSSAIALVGDDRFETARKVAETFFTSPAAAGIASGLLFPDALAGGAHAAKRGGPLLLTQPEKLTETTRAYLSNNKAAIDTAFIYGGAVAVASGVDNEVKTAITD